MTRKTPMVRNDTRSRRHGGLLHELLLALGIALLAALLQAPAVSAAERVGGVVLARNDVQGTPTGGSAVALAVGSDVLLDMEVATGDDSAAKMTFEPRGSLTLGAEARITFDRAEVDEITGATRSWFSVLVGKIRLALTPGSPGEVEVDTPAATIGVKGTDVRIEVDRRGSTLVAVLEGEVTVTAKTGGPTITVRAGDMTVVEPGRRPTPPAPLDVSGSTQGPSADGPDFTVPQEDLPDSPGRLIFENVPVDRGGDFFDRAPPPAPTASPP